jgi:hypothetical protein
VKLTTEQRLEAYVELADSYPVETLAGMEVMELVGLIVHVRRELVEAAKDSHFDSTVSLRLNHRIEHILGRLRPAPVQDPIMSIPQTNSSDLRMRRTSRAKATDSNVNELDQRAIEQEMLSMTGDMRETAFSLHSTIKKDIATLSNTAELQDDNLTNTKNQNIRAQNIRSSKRLSFMMTMVMIAFSALIFLILVPIIIVT